MGFLHLTLTLIDVVGMMLAMTESLSEKVNSNISQVVATHSSANSVTWTNSYGFSSGRRAGQRHLCTITLLRKQPSGTHGFIAGDGSDAFRACAAWGLSQCGILNLPGRNFSLQVILRNVHLEIFPGSSVFVFVF